jgi:predicted DNA-binding protein
MLEPLVIIIATALLSSGITLVCAWLFFQRMWRQEMEHRLRELHDDIGRTVEVRVKRAVAEALSDMNTGEVLREATWKAARSGSDLLSDGLNVLLGKRRRQDDA